MISKLELLRAARTRAGLADLIGTKLNSLTYTLYKIPREKHYTSFSIPKKSGEDRHIDAPIKRLRTLQRGLADLLLDCLTELEADSKYSTPVYHGFARGRGIVSNAENHIARRFVLNADLSDFFGHIHFGRVRGFFLKNPKFKLSEEVATTIAQIACFNNHLPQGAPSSPVISNLIARSLDVKLTSLAKAHKVTYTRYADDLTFSTNAKAFPSAIAKRAILRRSLWKPSGTLTKAIKSSGFTLNRAKTRMQIRGSRQEVTGLTTNKKVNISQRYYRDTRAMCSSLFRTGTYFKPGEIDQDGKPKLIASLNPLEGRLAFIHRVRARMDRADKLNDELISKGEFVYPEGSRKLYAQLLDFKYLSGSVSPFIITEGKTDITYLKCALRARESVFPALFKEDDRGKTRPIFSYLSARGSKIKIMKVPEGATGVAKLVRDFKVRTKTFEKALSIHPVIVVVDNDKGGKNVFDAANSHGVTITLSDAKVWFHICENLYVVKTPPSGSVPFHSDMEGFFSASAKSTLISGKSFNPDPKSFDAKKNYGKQVFADKVVRAISDKNEFAGFDVMLNAFDEIMKDFSKRK